MRIDQIKALSLDEIHGVYAEGNSWLVYKRNELEAVVECHPIDFMAEMLKKGTRCAVLKFYARKRDRVQSGEGGGSGGVSGEASRNSSSPGTVTPPEAGAGADAAAEGDEGRDVRRLSVARATELGRPPNAVERVVQGLTSWRGTPD